MNKKVILIQGLLAPYRYPIFERISKNPNLDFEVWFMGHEVKNRVWDELNLEKYQFKYKFLDGITLNFGIKDNYPFWINPSIFKILFKSKPDVVVMMGWDSITSFLSHIYCFLTKTKFVLYSDSTIAEKSWRRTVTKPIVKIHVCSSDTLISGGTRNSEYLQSLGANKDKIFISYNTVDTNKYAALSDKYKKDKFLIKESLGINNKKVIMYYAQFLERKGGDTLLYAFMKLKETHDDIYLIMIGDGQFKEKISNIILDNNIQDVILLDNPGDEEICKFYAIADIFVLPSREDVWGLVVNEAMSSGLPVVVSNNAGSAKDLVVDGSNGYTFKPNNKNDLSNKLELIIKDSQLRMQMGKKSSEIIKNFSPELTIRKFVEAINV